MDDGGPTASIILFIVLLLLDSFFYGFGAALRVQNEKEVEEKAEQGSLRAKRLLQMMKRPMAFVNTLQLVVTVIHISMGGFYLRFWSTYLHNIWGTAIIMVALVLSVGILIPKRLGTKYAEQFAWLFVNPVWIVTLVLLPFTSIVSLISAMVLRLFGIHKEEEPEDVTEEEILSMVNEGHEQGVLQASEAEMINNIFELDDKEAKDIMTNRSNIIAVDGSISLQDAVSFMLENNNSRYPVYEENIDHIIGILHMKDALRMQSEFERKGMVEKKKLSIRDISGLLREAKFIPETRNIDELFRRMQSTKTQMVIVIDEYGQTVGLVAMEDILEEIVGNILDEYDEDSEHIEEKGEDQYVIDGMTRLDELEERLDISFEQEDFDTLNGFLISKLDRIPDERDVQFEVTVGAYDFKVLSVENKIIQSVLVTRHINVPKEQETEQKE